MQAILEFVGVESSMHGIGSAPATTVCTTPTFFSARNIMFSSHLFEDVQSLALQ